MEKRYKKLMVKILSILIAVLMISNMVGWERIAAYAINPSDFNVETITVYRIYDRNGNLETSRVTIKAAEGSNIMDAEIFINKGTGYEPVGTKEINSVSMIQFVLDDDRLGKSIMIQGVDISLGEENMPDLSGVTRNVTRDSTESNGKIILEGSNLDKIIDGAGTGPSAEVQAKYKHHKGMAGNYFPDFTSATASEYVTNNLTGDLGFQDIIFEKTQVVQPVNFPGHPNEDVTVEIVHYYQEQFRLVDNINNVDDLKMFPNRGESGDKVYFTAQTLDQYDVFFLTDIDGTDPYTNANKGLNKTFASDSGESNEDILTVEVPDIDVGEYYVVLTNPIAQDKNPMEEVNQVHIVKVNDGSPDPPEEKFHVIDGNTKALIINVQPNSGPDSGQKVKISGEFLGTMNIPQFNADKPDVVNVAYPGGDAEVLEITYSEDDAGDPDAYVGDYNGLDVISAKRTINITIGDKVKFAPNDDDPPTAYDYSFTSVLDILGVITPQINDAESDPVKDVVAEIETVFEIDDNGDMAVDSIISIKERAELKDGYTYIPSKTTPTITEVIPQKIQVTANGPSFETQEDILIGIYGENFAIHKYDDGSGEKLMYPRIEIGEIVLNKSFDTESAYDPNVDIRIFNDQGEELDGTEGNEMGTKILVTIPSGKTITNIGKTFARITNPVRNANVIGLSSQLNNAVEFVMPDANKIPVINEVNPSVVTIDGGEEVKILGSNFQDGVMVFIDGVKVEGVNRSQDGKEITFTSPPGREGETQLLVMNEEGGMDTHVFTYVKTYTDPKINDFAPKKGNTGTLVVIDGDNFLRPDPTADEDSIFKFIGTRVYFEGIDINVYNLDTATKKIILKDYEAENSAEKVLRISEGKLKLEDYYHSIILKREVPSDVFYTIDVDSKGTPYITNGVDEKYVIGINGSTIKAEKEGGGSFTLSVETDATGDYIQLVEGITTLNLRIQTPFKVDNGIITGDRVKVIDKNKIYFTVPILQTDGYYDLSVVNPDTKKDTKKDEEGFYYFRQPQSNPKIISIDPDQGSNEGGYTISITGSEFMDNGTSKTQVFINGVEVDGEDVTISTDGTQITVKVPAYKGDLGSDLDTDRITVPVTVLNPDGGSDSIEEGFTYIVPTSNPEITDIIPDNGNAAGGDIIEIVGFDFRFFEPFDDENRNQAWDPNEEYEDINNDNKWNNEQQLGTDEDWSEPIAFDHQIYDHYFSSPILPRVYFGDKQAKIVEFSMGYLKVILPPSQEASVDVHVVNNDSGISNKVKFTYNSSNPTISSVIPNEGRKQGRDKVEIRGQNFQKSYISVYNYNSSGNIIQENKSIVLVNFGRITNKDIPREQENSGLINSGRTTVNLDGGFKIEYDGVNNTLKPFIEENEILYQIPGGITGYEDTDRYIDVSMLKDSEGNAYSGHELIRVWVEDRRLFVERGYSPKVEYINDQYIIVDTSSYYTIGTVPLFIINPDGGEAESKFTYKNPDSLPKITNITKEGRDPIEKDGVRVVEVTYKGGNIISVYGEDFREEAIIQISDILTINEGDIAYQLPNRLTFTMPAVPESAIGDLHRVVVKNKDGGIASSDMAEPPLYIQFIKGETIPSIAKIIPGKGPSTGGTKVTIEGEDFRDVMNGQRISVYFGSTKVPENDVNVINYKTIEVYTPPHAPGEVEVKIENPDGELSVPVGTFIYISTPKITSVVDPTNDKKIYTISVDGGEKIRIKGSGFNSDAKVIFNPVLEEVEDEESASGELVYIGEQIYVLKEGIRAPKVEYKDSETLDITTPKGKLGSLSIIVINGDEGGSNIYKGLEYGLPDISPPNNVVATLMYDKYIKVEWDSVEDAFDYEVFVIIDNKGAEYIGSTASTFIAYEDLESRTEYKFLVKSVGEYGESLKYGESNTVKTGRSVEEIEDEDGEIGENTTTRTIGDKVELTLGTSDYDDQDIKLDLTKTELAGAKEVIVSMPAEVISSYDARDITIIGGDFKIKFNPKIFYNSTIRENKSNDEVGVRFTIGFGSEALKNNQVKAHKSSLSNSLVLEGYLFNEKQHEDIEHLEGAFEVMLDFDSNKAKMRRYKRVELCRYDSYESKWTAIASTEHEYTVSIRTLVDRLGKYSVIGKRER